MRLFISDDTEKSCRKLEVSDSLIRRDFFIIDINIEMFLLSNFVIKFLIKRVLSFLHPESRMDMHMVIFSQLHLCFVSRSERNEMFN